MSQVGQAKQQTQAAYDQYAAKFSAAHYQHFLANVQGQADRFLELLPGSTVLDIGCGAGDHAAYFVAAGRHVVCGDISPAMVALARSKGLDARQLDLAALPFPAASFDGIWAHTSLLHLPKRQLPPVAARLVDIVRPGGLVAISVKEGTGEGFELERPEYPGVRRWFSYFRPGDIERLFAQTELLNQDRLVTSKHIFLRYLFRRPA